MAGELGTKYGTGGNTAGGELGSGSIGDNSKYFYTEKKGGCLSALLTIAGIFAIVGATGWYVLS